MRGLELVTEYEEKASAARVRPVFDRMVRDAHRGAFDVLVVWALDRPLASLGPEVERLVVGRLGELRAAVEALCRTLTGVGAGSAEGAANATVSYGA